MVISVVVAIIGNFLALKTQLFGHVNANAAVMHVSENKTLATSLAISSATTEDTAADMTHAVCSTLTRACHCVTAHLGVLQDSLGVLPHRSRSTLLLIGFDPADVFTSPEPPLL